jgi:hypothetical protein
MSTVTASALTQLASSVEAAERLSRVAVDWLGADTISFDARRSRARQVGAEQVSHMPDRRPSAKRHGGHHQSPPSPIVAIIWRADRRS